MQKTLRIRTTVLPGGKIEIVDEELPVGEAVEVVISHLSQPPTRSAWQIISEGPGQRLLDRQGSR